jgi:hypothetical protein
MNEAMSRAQLRSSPVASWCNRGMLLNIDDRAATAVLGAAKSVGTGAGRHELSDAAATAISTFAPLALGVAPPDIGTLAQPEAGELAARLSNPEECATAVEMLAVTSLVDGGFDDARIGTVLEFADALDVRDGWLNDLSMSLEPDLTPVVEDMNDHNLQSITDGRVHLSEISDINMWLEPYDPDGDDSGLAERYEDLASLPEGSFGHAFWSFFERRHFPFAGRPGAVNEVFATPHGSTHVISGYDTTPQGEMLVSTFTSRMHPLYPMSGHVLPVIYSWHLGVECNELTGCFQGALDPAKMWMAWNRGKHAAADTFDPSFAFWDHAERPLDAVRDDFGVEPLDPAFAASSEGATPGVDYRPLA